MFIQYERYDFANGTVETKEREIDSAAVLAGNPFFQLMSRNMAKKPKPSKPYPPMKPSKGGKKGC
jgi:hypothetical protein